MSQLRVSPFVVIPLSLALLGLAMTSPFVAAKNGGNNLNAKSCYKNGWTNLQRSDGTLFTSQDACTSYAAQGGSLEPKSTAVLDQSSYGRICGTAYVTGQTFTAGLTGHLTRVDVMAANDSLEGLTLEVRAASGGLPTSTVLASQTITSSTTQAFVSTTFDTPPSVAAGTLYAWDLLSFSGALGCGSGAYSGGQWVLASEVPPTTWVVPFESLDLMFRTYVGQ